MKKRIGRRLVSLLLTVVTVLTLLPAMTLPARAATTVSGLADKTIDLSFTGGADNAWEAVGRTTIRGLANGFGTGLKRKRTSTLTIKNNKATAATLSFDYTIEIKKDSNTPKLNGEIKVDGTSVTAGGKISKELGQGDSINVYIDSGKGDGMYARITMTNVKLVANVNATVTFQPAENGSYKVGGKTITDTYTNTQIATKTYQVDATPAAGYQFVDWYDVSHNESISRVRKTELNIEKDCTIKARFTHKDLALFETGGLVYDDLTKAIAAASVKPSPLITQVGDGTISGSYTIPSGVTLLIPFDEEETLYTDKPAYVTDYQTPSVFRKLTMAPGSSIEVNGAISVGGKHSSAQGNHGPSGPYGQIDMAAGSSIVLKNRANLYAWGYITGDGQITAESGAKVYEYFQVRDWRGGSATKDMILSPTNHVFPFSQYYVQNIEAPLTLQYGASEKTYISLTSSGATVSTSIDFIGSTGLFKLEREGSIIKRYVPATGRTEYTTNGTAYLDHLAVGMEFLGITYTIDSKNYVLPINGNMTLNIASGKVTSNYDLCLLPGVQINIAKDAELEIAKDAGLYVYDSEEWGGYCSPQNKLLDVNYSPTPGWYVRKEADLVDAKININGTLTAIGGRTGPWGFYDYHNIYTTASGANICSSEGGGRYVQQSKPEGTNSTTRQAKQNGTDISYADIPITPAKLKNANGSYTETKDAKAGDTFTYCTCPTCSGGKWTNGLQVAAIINGNGEQVKTYSTLEAAVKAYSPDNNTAPTNYIKLLHNTTEKTISVSNKSLYLDLNGRTVTGDISVTGAYKLYGMDSSTGTGYDTAPSGKIVGKVTGTVAPVFEKPLTGDAEYNYLRYVAIKNEEGTEYTFHRFNISVSGYRFELATGDKPQCALFFIGKFQGDAEAKKHLTSLGFTLKDNIDGTEQNYICEITGKNIPKMPTEGEVSTSEVVQDAEGAYFFEAYLMRSFDKNNAATYQTPFSATAQATFKNDGTQQSDPQNLSFEDAWKNAKGLTPEQKAILKKFLPDLDINP